MQNEEVAEARQKDNQQAKVLEAFEQEMQKKTQVQTEQKPFSAGKTLE